MNSAAFHSAIFRGFVPGAQSWNSPLPFHTHTHPCMHTTHTFLSAPPWAKHRKFRSPWTLGARGGHKLLLICVFHHVCFACPMDSLTQRKDTMRSQGLTLLVTCNWPIQAPDCNLLYGVTAFNTIHLDVTHSRKSCQPMPLLPLCILQVWKSGHPRPAEE